MGSGHISHVLHDEASEDCNLENAERLKGYFNRFGHHGSSEPTLGNLRQITWLHQLAIAFENLDIVLFLRPISLTMDDIFDKLVISGRGGFCFEHNGLLAQALTWMGYGVTMGYSTWLSDEGEQIPPFDHLLLQVGIPGDATSWLADAGFGRESPARPVPLQPDREDHYPETGLTYRVLPFKSVERQWAVQWRASSDDWAPLYDLDLRPRSMADYEHRSRYHQTSPDSHFMRGPICSRPMTNGRVSFAHGTLTLTHNGQREERVLSGPEEERSVLHQWFGIDLSQEEQT